MLSLHTSPAQTNERQLASDQMVQYMRVCVYICIYLYIHTHHMMRCSLASCIPAACAIRDGSTFKNFDAAVNIFIWRRRQSVYFRFTQPELTASFDTADEFDLQNCCIPSQKANKCKVLGLRLLSRVITVNHPQSAGYISASSD